MGFWSGLFGGGKTAETTADTINTAVDGVVSGIDKLFYMEEEKVENAIKIMDIKLKAADGLAAHVQATQSENTLRSKTRREISIMIIKTWIAMMLLNLVVYVWNKETGKEMLDVVEAYGLPTAVIMVLAFFFSLYGLNIAKDAIGKVRGTRFYPAAVEK